MDVRIYTVEEQERTKIVAEVYPFDDPKYAIVVRKGSVEFDGCVMLTTVQSVNDFIAGIREAAALAAGKV